MHDILSAHACGCHIKPPSVYLDQRHGSSSSSTLADQLSGAWASITTRMPSSSSSSSSATRASKPAEGEREFERDGDGNIHLGRFCCSPACCGRSISRAKSRCKGLREGSEEGVKAERELDRERVRHERCRAVREKWIQERVQRAGGEEEWKMRWIT